MPDSFWTPAIASGDRGSSRCDPLHAGVRVLVTGGAGFIGSNLCRRLEQQVFIDDIVVLDDLSTGTRQNLTDCPAVELIEGSIVNADDLETAVKGVDAIVHLAARPSVPRSLADPMATHHVNATGTMMVLEAARRHGMPHVVVASSSSVYGANPLLPKQEAMQVLPASPYAASKLATESYALAYQRSFGLPVLAFRFFNVFGPFQPAGHAYAAVIPVFVSAALAGDPLPVDGDGTQTRDFTFVDTVTSVLTDAVRRTVVDDQPVNFGVWLARLPIGADPPARGHFRPWPHSPAPRPEARRRAALASRQQPPGTTLSPDRAQPLAGESPGHRQLAP